MKTFNQLLESALIEIPEIFPWDLVPLLETDDKPILLDIREAYEYEYSHIANSIWVPRGNLEQACEWNYDVTVPELVESRNKKVIVICRSGTRSILAALTMKIMGFQDVYSLKTGVRGWNDFDQPMVDPNGMVVDPDEADEFLANKVRPEQLEPKLR